MHQHGPSYTGGQIGGNGKVKRKSTQAPEQWRLWDTWCLTRSVSQDAHEPAHQGPAVQGGDGGGHNPAGSAAGNQRVQNAPGHIGH